jgi:hypothetical protein
MKELITVVSDNADFLDGEPNKSKSSHTQAVEEEQILMGTLKHSMMIPVVWNHLLVMTQT